MADLKGALLQGQPAADFQRMDLDGDGRVSLQEFQFAQMDRDGDGRVSREEMAAYQAQQRQQGQMGMPVQMGQLVPPVQMGMPPLAQAGTSAIAGAVGGAIAGAVAAGAAHSGGHLPVVQGGHGAAGGPMQRLKSTSRLEIKESADFLEELTTAMGAEVNMANKYDIFDNSGTRLFQAVEMTSAGDRQCQNCCCHDCAAWDVKFSHVPVGAQVGHGQAFLRMHRDWQCTCCCIKRPVAYVEDLTGSVAGHFGWLRDPCTCGSLKFDMNIGEETFVLDGGCPCCQCGWCCPLPCGPCSKIKFDVNDADSRKIATIERSIPSCALWWAGSSIDNYKVDYVVDMEAQKKAMIMSLAIFMDFRYFNKAKKQERPAGH